jgi:hypothetical protein
MAELELAKDLTYEKKPLRILDEMERVTRGKGIRFYKVQWECHTEDEAAWEREDYLRTAYPYLFSEQPNLGDKIHHKGEVCNTLVFALSFNWIYLAVSNLNLNFLSTQLT